MLAAVNMGAKGDALIADIPQSSQTEYLIAPAISDYRPIPAHKSMESAHSFDDIYPRPQVEVIGISHYYRYVQALQFLGGHRLHRTLTAHRRKHGGGNYPVRRNQLASPGVTIGTILYGAEYACIAYGSLLLS